MSSRVKDTDLGYKRTMQILRDLLGAEVLVGVRGNAGDSEDGTPLAVIAAANEFGTATIPERSFLRSTVESNRGKYADDLQEVVEAVVDGKANAMEQGLNRLGVEAVADVQRTMRELDDPPNAASTIARKGTDNPLIDTGRLRQSIDHEVREKGE